MRITLIIMIATKYPPAPHHDFQLQTLVSRTALTRWCAVALALAIALALAPRCLAAALPLSGTITDALGRPLAGVNVELRNENGRTVSHGVTEHAGHFKMGPANPGIYSLDAGKPGCHVVFVHGPLTGRVPLENGFASLMPAYLAP